MAEMGFIPAGAYRNREYASKNVIVGEGITRAMLEIFYDPHTSGGLLISAPEKDGLRMLEEIRNTVPDAALIGYVAEKQAADITVE